MRIDNVNIFVKKDEQLFIHHKHYPELDAYQHTIKISGSEDEWRAPSVVIHIDDSSAVWEFINAMRKCAVWRERRNKDA